MYTKIRRTSDSFTFRFLLIAKESRRDYFSLRIDTARGWPITKPRPDPDATKRLFRVAPLLVCTTHHRNKLRFIPREFPQNILFPTPLEQPLRRSLRDSIIARWVHPGFIRDTRFLIALLNVNDGRWSNRSAGQWMKNFFATNWHCY